MKFLCLSKAKAFSSLHRIERAQLRASWGGKRRLLREIMDQFRERQDWKAAQRHPSPPRRTKKKRERKKDEVKRVAAKSSLFTLLHNISKGSDVKSATS